MLGLSEPVSRGVVQFYFPSLSGGPFGDKAEILVNGEDGRLRIEYINHQRYNAREFEDYAAYSIPKGSKLYLKLSNNDIITLTCESYQDVNDGYVEGKSGVYYAYKNCSYFPIDENTIALLRNFEIIKIRAELKKGIYDGSLRFTETSKPNKSDFNSAYQYVTEQIQKARNESSRQLELKDNPLLDF